MGYVAALKLRMRQEHAEKLIERRIEKYERQLAKLKRIAREIKNADWGDQESRRI